MPLAATAASQSLPRIDLMVIVLTVGDVIQCTVTGWGMGEERGAKRLLAGPCVVGSGIAVQC